MSVSDQPSKALTAERIPARLQQIVHNVLPHAQILRVVPLEADAAVSTESAKSAGYGAPLRLDIVEGGSERSLVLHTVTSNEFGHDRRADRAAEVLLAADTFGLIPRHVAVLDVGTYRDDEGFTSLLGSGEFYTLTTYAEGTVYADDLRAIAERGQASELDRQRHTALVDFLAKLHAGTLPAGNAVYARSIRDTLGSGEGLFGISDSYPDSTAEASRARLDAIEEACLRKRFQLRRRGDRLRRIHGDFHPFNIVFGAGTELAMLDTSRGSAGDPADDVTCMAINYPFFSLGQPGAWRGAFAALWHDFWRSYIERTGDTALREVAPLFLAWRGLVLANPLWYPKLPPADRNRVLGFVEAALASPRFRPELAREYFEQ